MLLANTKAERAMIEMKTINGLKILFNEIPALFIAVNSLCSERAPIVMMLDIKTANGRAILTIRAEAKINNCTMSMNSKSLPNKSSIYNQINCNSKINKDTKKVMMNGPIKAFNKTSDIFFG